MLKSIKEWLQKPYYFNESDNFKLTISFYLGVFVFLFIVLFKPLGIELPNINHYAFKAFYGIATTCILLFFFFVIAKLFPSYFSDENWTIGKQIYSVLLIMLTCGIVNWLYTISILTEAHYKTKISFLKILGYSMTVGTIPTLIYMYFDERYHFNKYNNFNHKKNRKENKNVSINENVTIYASNNTDNFTFKLKNIVYITSESNYACFYIKNGMNLKEYILRVPLQKVEYDLKKYKHLFRCHKSYIINTNYVHKIIGNARGYNLQIRNTDKIIPISRKYTKDELKNILF